MARPKHPHRVRLVNPDVLETSQFAAALADALEHLHMEAIKYEQKRKEAQSARVLEERWITGLDVSCR